MSTFYDRSSNFSIAIGDQLVSQMDQTVLWGSKYTYSSKANVYETQHGIVNLMPMGINNISIAVEIKFMGDKSKISKIADLMERKGGHEKIYVFDPSYFYKTITMTGDSYTVNHLSGDIYEIVLSLEVYDMPSLLKWDSSPVLNFLNAPIITDIKTDYTKYEKYDIAYFPNGDIPLNSFYYCTDDHESTVYTRPNGTLKKWSNEFLFVPDVSSQQEVKIKADKIELKNSFTQKSKTRRNTASFDQFSYRFTNISEKQARAILHFLENKAGYRRFLHTIPSLFDKPKVLFAPSWSHTMNFANSHTIEITLVEDPLGVIPKGQ